MSPQRNTGSRKLDRTLPSPHRVWMDQGACSIDAFRTLVEVQTPSATVPLADDIVCNIPIYEADNIRSVLDDTTTLNAYMAEWNHVFRDGAGITVFRNAFSDSNLIDNVTIILNDIIDREKKLKTQGGDHFAPPGANSRVWNAHEKLCMSSPEIFAHYNANHIVPLISRAWLGPFYQLTTQVNVVRPGGKAQIAHRDYHMGFQSADILALYPAHAHALSAALTLQGAVAHSDMPIESGPTKLLPFSQTYLPGYFATTLPEFREYFEVNYVQLPLNKGDAFFFNPAVFHAAGENRTSDVHRFANLMQIGSGFGRSTEIVDRARISAAVFPALKRLHASGALDHREVDNVVAVCAEGYPFPINLDIDSPLDGMTVPSQQDLMREALRSHWSTERFSTALGAQSARRTSH